MVAGQAVGRRRYTLRHQLGQGGMGVVWLAHDTRLDKLVALKFLSDQLRFDPAGINELRRETLRSLQLTHPNILRIYDLVEEEGELPFISMEYVVGMNLTALRLEQPQPILTWDLLGPLAAQLCDALDYAHGQRIIHRDLKPSNLMLDNKGALKLTDFGVAAVVAETLSRVTGKETKGTPSYMSPEQLRGLSAQVTDDIYALGATLYELLTSKPPFYSGDISYQVRNVAAEPMEARLGAFNLRNDIPPAVSATVMACLAKEAAQRPTSARAVKEMLFGTRTISPEDLPETVAVEPEPAAHAMSLPSRRIAWAAFGVVCVAVAGLVTMALKQTGQKPVAAPPAVTGTASPATEPPGALLLPSPNEEGFQPLFNGTNFGGWSAQPKEAWAIEGGSVVGKAAVDDDSHLIRSAELGDFELRFSWKASPSPGASLAFRSARNAHGQLATRYLALLTGPRPGTILVSDEGRYVPPVAVGQSVELDDGRWKRTGSASPANDTPTIHPNEWNDFTLIARGNRFACFINGVASASLTDCLPTASLRGALYFRVVSSAESNPTLQVRNLRLRTLPPLPALAGKASPALETLPLSPLPSRTEEGFETIFNGGEPDEEGVWSFPDGTLHGVLDKPGRTAMVGWKKDVGDFEMRFSARVQGRASFRYREQPRSAESASPFVMMVLSDESPGAIGRVSHGQISTFGPGAVTALRDGKLLRMATIRASKEALLKEYKAGDWNDYIVIARAGRFTHYVNGVLFQEYINEDFDPADAAGRISFRLSTQIVAPPAAIEVRNARIKLLAP
ncbi:MAG: family 16 glycoside hydrolase [Verrucomicrobiota bacterium]